MNPWVGFHHRLHVDLREILDHYKNESGARLADEFNEELQNRVNTARDNPTFFPHYRSDIRRAILKRFPYHFLYEIRTTSVWIFVLRHNKRNPDYGMKRL